MVLLVTDDSFFKLKNSFIVGLDNYHSESVAPSNVMFTFDGA